MIIRSEEFKNICAKILSALDSNPLSPITDTVELKTDVGYLYINITNMDYFVQCKVETGNSEDFHAAVNAGLFLKLVSLITTDTIELIIRDNQLILKGNGTYKIPLIYQNDSIMTLPEITIQNPTANFEIDSNVLLSILQYNSKEVNKEGVIVKPVQKLYYVDDYGALTFTSSGGCVNSFRLPSPIKMLLPNKIVKLFRLFKGETVNFTLGHDALSNEIIQTKVQFETNNIRITAIIACDDSLLRSVPVEAIRGRANFEYPYSVNINKEAFLQAVNRMMLFAPKDKMNLYSKFEFKRDCIVIYDIKGESKEEIYYTGNTIDAEYEVTLDFLDLKTTFESCNEPYVNIHFGNEVALVISRGNIRNIISEAHPTME